MNTQLRPVRPTTARRCRRARTPDRGLRLGRHASELRRVVRHVRRRDDCTARLRRTVATVDSVDDDRFRRRRRTGRLAESDAHRDDVRHRCGRPAGGRRPVLRLPGGGAGAPERAVRLRQQRRGDRGLRARSGADRRRLQRSRTAARRTRHRLVGRAGGDRRSTTRSARSRNSVRRPVTRPRRPRWSSRCSPRSTRSSQRRRRPPNR